MAKRMSADNGTGATGHNSGVDPDTFVDFYRQLVEADTELAQAQSKRSNLLAKAKKAGVKLEQLKALRTLSKMDDEDVQNQFRTLFKYAAWIGKPIGTQADLFGADDDQKPSDNAVSALALGEAKQRGYTDATHKAPRDNNPYTVGSDLAAEWDRGWHAGNEFMVASGKLNAQESSNGGRRRRGGARVTDEPAGTA